MEFQGTGINTFQMMMMMVRLLTLLHLLPALLFFLTCPSLVMYGVSAQTSAATCIASIQAFQMACDPATSTAATCCPVYETQVNAYYDCYCSANTTFLIEFAAACGFTLPQNLTSCFTAGNIYIHTHTHTHTHTYIHI